jgi:chromosome segregation protein
VDLHLTSAPAPRLTRLELFGFKSFASRTLFRFEPGITAIVGPNGSGKSNVADAVRWVLGETSHGLLRSRKTEDVIFAGGKGRAPAGMAEVAVTFDNTSGWLPIAFAEVSVTRRAYRSGENHFLINGRRVRLKDVHQLVASLGQSYTVVGQGLVDAALSQRPEERRGLFEHAADLTGLRLRAAEAERNLADAEANAVRISDLLVELEPRLKTLERAARQAKEWQGLADRLRDLQRVHYGQLYRAARARLAAAEAAAAGDRAAVDAAQAELDRLHEVAASTQRALEDARAHLAAHDARLTAVADQARRAAHERDLAAERHAALSRRREDMADTQAGLDEQVAAVARDLAAVASELEGIEREVAGMRGRVADLQREEVAARAGRARTERRVADLANALADGERRAADLARRRALLAQRHETDAAERERLAAQIGERAERVGRLEAELAAFDEAAAGDDAALATLAVRLAELETEAERAQARVTEARTASAGAEHRLGHATTRLEALQRLHESGTGLFAGVRATLQAARDGTLRGVRGTLAELIEVPATYDTAIEVALGGHLQDIVVERWVDAEAAIAHLKRTDAGRATFQPLDTVRGGGGAEGRRGGGGASDRPPASPPHRPPAHGVAADLVGAAPDVAIVVRALLGRTLVVDDLPAARAALPALPSGWSAVTLAGEIARTGGSVTGGAAVRESGTLGRERELRELPREIRRLTEARDAAHAAQEAVAAEPRRVAEARGAVETERAGLLAAKKERAGQRARLSGWLDDLRREQTGAERRLAGLVASAADQAGGASQLADEESALAAATARAQEEHAAALTDLTRETEAAAGAERALAAEGRTLAALEERLRAERRRQTGLQAQERALAEEFAHRAERAAALDGERIALAAQHERLARDAAGLESERSLLQTGRGPLDSAVRRAESEVTRIARAAEAARESLLAAERAHGAGELHVERAHGEVATIAQRIRDDLELEDPDELGRQDGGTAGRLEEDELSPPSRPPAVPPSVDAEREIARLKERLRRVGYVGEDVVGEYEREAAHHAFLRGQLNDVEGAAVSLRTLLNDLERTMRERFDATFSRVATAFTEAFTMLFGGGTARLILAPGEDGSPGGVDIVAQPPGKRLQGLALLSGGERALTAAALMIAILRVNPTPFCLLDEVDAALDEANIVRFREQLQGLAHETQVIVITHNRGTIEIADTLYGVSMGDDGVSQVLSLRLAEAVATP